MLTRLFAYFTLFTYLVVGVAAVRVFMPETSTIEISTAHLSYFSKSQFKSPVTEEIIAPELAFSDIKFPTEKKAPAINNVKVIVAEKKQVLEKVSGYVLPFSETIEVSPVIMKNVLPVNHVALYKEFKEEAFAVAAAPQVDEVSTKQAAVEVEPEFFEYPENVKEVFVNNNEEKSSTIPQTVADVDESKNVEKAVEEIAVDDLITFDYSKAQIDIKTQNVPSISKMTTQSAPEASNNALSGMGTQASQPLSPMKWTMNQKTSKKVVTTQNTDKNNFLKKEVNALVDNQQEEVNKFHPSRVAIKITGTDLVTTQEEVGFEVRPQDDLSETISDYNNGEVIMEHDLARPKMTRAVTVLKRGYAPTNTDLILEEGSTEISLPLINEGKFNEMLAPYESRGPIGAVLVELDDDADSASLDVPFSQVLKLDENMKPTSGSQFSYQLFIGVKSGNALLRYKDHKGEMTSKIIHIHERELTFESNFFEQVKDETIKLVEEDLLSKEKNPLILSTEEVRQFATDKTAKKINDHTYRTEFNKTTLGGRKYLELGHQHEPVFVGFKESKTLEIPSENFMRYILSIFEGSKLGNRCLVQVNLEKKAVRVDVAAESVGQSLQTYTQVLDADGKFYDSVGEKSNKIIIAGENQGSSDYGQDARINIKITYQDGSVQFLGSYCSPNTYLVEQL